MKGKGLRALGLLCALVAVLLAWAAPTPAWAAEGDVARIERTGEEYATLDEAISDAQNGDTVTLLGDCELTKGFQKSLTFTGSGKITSVGQLTAGGEPNFWLNGNALTFDGAGVSWDWTSGGTNWLMLNLGANSSLNVKNGAVVTLRLDSEFTGTRNAIYMSAGSSVNVSAGSTLQILGQRTAGYSGQGIQLDSAACGSVSVTGGSTFLIDGTNRGYVNSPTIYVEDSTFTVQNCT